MPRALVVALVAAVVPAFAQAQSWLQWGANAQHDSATAQPARRLERIEQDVVIDPNAGRMEMLAGDELLAHYPVPLIDGDDVVLLRKGGFINNLATRDSQTWSVVAMRRVHGQLADRWTYLSDWKPVPFGTPAWEPVYHPAMSADSVWAPGAGGTVDQLNRETGALVRRFNPFGATADPSIFVCGPLTIDGGGNVYYNAIQFAASPWSSDPVSSWLVRISAGGTITTATFASLTPQAPAAGDSCTAIFDTNQLPWPPSPNAAAPSIRCGAQRPGMNVAPAVAPDGTIYTISRAHANSRWAFLVAVNPDMTPKWAASLRHRFQDGCDVLVPPSGTPGGCRAGSAKGVDPADNEAGSGAVNDDSTSSPVVTPDGRILYGSYTRYNYAQGHLMLFSAEGAFLASYPWGWDLTPAIYRHGSTYSIILKENHYSLGSYCNDGNVCPPDRTSNTPADPAAYNITQLDAALQPEWKFRNTNTLSCERLSDGSLQCLDDHPYGFEWCVNAVAVDGRGVVYANSEDGNLYAIAQGGVPDSSIFLRLAIGAAYTPTSIGPDGRVYTQNDGDLFVITQNPKRRAVGR